MKKFVRSFGMVGLLVPVVVYPLWQWVNNGRNLQSKVNFEDFATVVWPSSILLMALEGSGSAISRSIIFAVSIAINGLLYAGVGLLLWGIGRAWNRLAAGD
jgi:hypothetical protein